MATLRLDDDIHEALDARRISYSEAIAEQEGRRMVGRIKRRMKTAQRKVHEIEDELLFLFAERARIRARMEGPAESPSDRDAALREAFGAFLDEHGVRRSFFVRGGRIHVGEPGDEENEAIDPDDGDVEKPEDDDAL